MHTTSRAIAGESDVRNVRAFVRSLLVGADDEAVEVAVLLSSEVATNAVQHGGGQLLLCVDRDRERVRVSVCDEAAGQPVSRRATADQERGRGMALVEALATSWGVETLVKGKRVWFDVDLVNGRTSTARAASPDSA